MESTSGFHLRPGGALPETRAEVGLRPRCPFSLSGALTPVPRVLSRPLFHGPLPSAPGSRPARALPRSPRTRAGERAGPARSPSPRPSRSRRARRRGSVVSRLGPRAPRARPPPLPPAPASAGRAPRRWYPHATRRRALLKEPTRRERASRGRPPRRGASGTFHPAAVEAPRDPPPLPEAPRALRCLHGGRAWKGTRRPGPSAPTVPRPKHAPVTPAWAEGPVRADLWSSNPKTSRVHKGRGSAETFIKLRDSATNA